MTRDELRAKYPKYKIIYDPKPDCRYCHGTGESRNDRPCICTCVHHDFAERAQELINKIASGLVVDEANYDKKG